MIARRIADWLCCCGLVFAGVSLVVAMVLLLTWHFVGAPVEPDWIGNVLMVALGGIAFFLVGSLLDDVLESLKGRRWP